MFAGKIACMMFDILWLTLWTFNFPHGQVSDLNLFKLFNFIFFETFWFKFYFTEALQVTCRLLE